MVADWRWRCRVWWHTIFSALALFFASETSVHVFCQRWVAANWRTACLTPRSLHVGLVSFLTFLFFRGAAEYDDPPINGTGTKVTGDRKANLSKTKRFIC